VSEGKPSVRPIGPCAVRQITIPLNSILAIRAVCCLPGIANHYVLAFRDDIFDGRVNVWKPLERGGQIPFQSIRSGRRTRRRIPPVFLVFGREIAFCNRQVFSVHKLFKMVADEFLVLLGAHTF
jgi:hypothetical protein